MSVKDDLSIIDSADMADVDERTRMRIENTEAFFFLVSMLRGDQLKR